MSKIVRSSGRRVAFQSAALGGIFLCVAAAFAQAPALPPIVEADISDSKKACEPERATLQQGFVTVKDINADGRDDFILDYGKFQCGDDTTYFCGSAGCLAQVFASLPGGKYVKVLDENVRRIRFATVKGSAAMLLDLHGSACGRTGAAPCAMTLLWNGSKFVPAK